MWKINKPNHLISLMTCICVITTDVHRPAVTDETNAY